MVCDDTTGTVDGLTVNVSVPRQSSKAAAESGDLRPQNFASVVSRLSG